MVVAYSRADHGYATLDSISHLPAYNAISSAFSYFARVNSKQGKWPKLTSGQGQRFPSSVFVMIKRFFKREVSAHWPVFFHSWLDLFGHPPLSEHCPNIEKCCWRPVGVSTWNRGVKYTEVTDGSGLFSSGSRIRDFGLHFPAPAHSTVSSVFPDMARVKTG